MRAAPRLLMAVALAASAARSPVGPPCALGNADDCAAQPALHRSTGAAARAPGLARRLLIERDDAKRRHTGGMPAAPCYGTIAERHAPLSGRWIDATAPYHHAYNNLSCSLEWSKYSCVHQGAVEHASAAARRVFEPSCELSRPRRDARVFAPGRTFHFVGDSLLRQMFVALGCILERHIVRAEANWPECGTGHNWPCHGTRRCVVCGAHSGFVDAQLHLDTGAVLSYRVSGADSMKNGLTLRNGDVVLAESGVHSRDSAAQTQKVFRTITGGVRAHNVSSSGVSLVWVVTPQDAFHARDGSGSYNASYIERGHRGCARHVPPVRSRAEWPVLRAHADEIDGVIDFEHLEDQGDVKIGGGVGSHGDCQHYCMPGIPDIYASAIYTMLRSLVSRRRRQRQ